MAAKPRTYWLRRAASTAQGNMRTFSQWRDGIFLSPLRRARRRDFHDARFCRAAPGDPKQIAAEMAAIKKKREASQPRNRTGGSTFKNPPGHKRLEAGRRCRLPRA